MKLDARKAVDEAIAAASALREKATTAVLAIHDERREVEIAAARVAQTVEGLRAEVAALTRLHERHHADLLAIVDRNAKDREDRHPWERTEDLIEIVGELLDARTS